MIADSLTLPELIAVVDKLSIGTVVLPKEEVDYLLFLLQSYAHEILGNGQRVQLGSVTMTKSLKGQVLIGLVSYIAQN
ncbi:MAG: hypothetical protein C0464_01045 [Cyanobacteria bacterium DS2.008]|nr:hypothetical protein [Cyanobacteria bacterium DS2.008]